MKIILSLSTYIKLYCLYILQLSIKLKIYFCNHLEILRDPALYFFNTHTYYVNSPIPFLENFGILLNILHFFFFFLSFPFLSLDYIHFILIIALYFKTQHILPPIKGLPISYKCDLESTLLLLSHISLIFLDLILKDWKSSLLIYSIHFRLY